MRLARSGRTWKTKQPRHLSVLGCLRLYPWLRGQDLNLRPLGYEPNELPDCSTPHLHRNNPSLSWSTHLQFSERGFLLVWASNATSAKTEHSTFYSRKEAFPASRPPMAPSVRPVRKRASTAIRSAAPVARLDAPDLYLNPHLSLLSFQRRVLEEAEDPAAPLL